MDDALLVRDGERVGDLDADSSASSSGSGPLLEPRRERLADEVLHDEVVESPLRADVVEDADVRMVQRRRRARFLLEATPTIGIGGSPGRQHLDRPPCGPGACRFAL